MVLLAKHSLVSFTDIFLDFWGPCRGSQKAIVWVIHALFQPKLSQIWPFWPRNHHQMALSDQNFPQMSDNAQSRWLPMVECILDPILGLSWVPKGLNLLIKWHFESPYKGLKSPKMGRWCLIWKAWPVGPSYRIRTQIWCRIWHPEGQKVPFRGRVDPLDIRKPPQSPCDAPVTPPNPPNTLYWPSLQPI